MKYHRAHSKCIIHGKCLLTKEITQGIRMEIPQAQPFLLPLPARIKVLK